MRIIFIIIAGATVATALSQNVSSVYNRDTHVPFNLKKIRVESQVVGPIVRTSTWLTYENPYKTPTEATLNFTMPDAAALGGFAYLYGDEYVRGRLMDKNKAWFIYTAITSRNRDPGIMEQWSPTDYHCQIFPIKKDRDLRVRLWTVGMLQPSGGKMTLPKPSAPRAVGYEAVDATQVKPEWDAKTLLPVPLAWDGQAYSVQLGGPVSAVAQRFKDGRVYVAGLVCSSLDPAAANRPITVVSARYEAANGTGAGADVTATLSSLVAEASQRIQVEDTTFGDPAPYVVKRLVVTYLVDGQLCKASVPEHGFLDLPPAPSPKAPTFFRLEQPKTVQMDAKTLAFAGWMPKNRMIAVRFNGVRYAFKPQPIPRGSDAARLWAQQMLATNRWMRVKDVLAFSLKYGVPSTATALLAVPNEEMKLYRAKEKEFQKAQAEQRRRELEAERNARNWAGRRSQNWSNSGGGDPEIRVVIPGARSVDAILPDRRVLSLTPQGDTWGGNFEIPADAVEGSYVVRVVAHMLDGTSVERTWTYQVQRTAPKGRIELVTISGRLVLEVHADPGLAEVAIYDATGMKWILHEDLPGLYRIEVSTEMAGSLTVVLKDRAGNKGELNCSLPR